MYKFSTYTLKRCEDVPHIGKVSYVRWAGNYNGLEYVLLDNVRNNLSQISGVVVEAMFDARRFEHYSDVHSNDTMLDDMSSVIGLDDAI